MIAIGILLLRRNQSVSGGELGGPKCIKTITSLIFMSLWFVYIGLSAMEAYGVITPGIWIYPPPPPPFPLQSASSSQLPPGVPVSTSTTKTTSQLQPCLKCSLFYTRQGAFGTFEIVKCVRSFAVHSLQLCQAFLWTFFQELKIIWKCWLFRFFALQFKTFFSPPPLFQEIWGGDWAIQWNIFSVLKVLKRP